jgi:hypothetical protein
LDAKRSPIPGVDDIVVAQCEFGSFVQLLRRRKAKISDRGFDIRNPAVEGYIRERSITGVCGITAETASGVGNN